MNKSIIIGLIALILLVSGCQYFSSNNKEATTGNVVIDNNFIFLDNNTNETQGTGNETINQTNNETSNKTSEETSNDEKQAKLEEGTDISEKDVAYTIRVTEGDLVNLAVKAVDPDGDEIEYTYTPPLNAQGRWQTRIGDEGKYLVTVTASDGKLSTSEDVLIIVERANRPPVIECPETITVKEGQELDINCNIYDEEGDDYKVEYEGFSEEKTKQTTYDDAGEYTELVRATDSNGGVSVKKIKIIIDNVNRAPIIEPIDDIKVMETNTVIVKPKVTDPDGDNVTISFSKPLDENGIWKTVDGDAGTYNVIVTATDGQATTTEAFKITVTNVNTPPVLKPIGDLVYEEGDKIILPVEAYDPEGDEITIKYEGFMDSQVYQTTYDDAGVYEETVTVSDGVLSTSETFKITIKNKNRPPVFVFGGEEE